MSQQAVVGGGAAAGSAAGGAMLTIGGKHLVSEPETVTATIAHLEGIAAQIAEVRRLDVHQFAGAPAGWDFTSSNALKNRTESASALKARMDEASSQVRTTIDNPRESRAAHTGSDVVGSGWSA